MGDMFNSDRTFSVPTACSDLDIDPNAHPHARTGQVLKAKWNEVCCATSDAVLVVDESTNGYGPIVSSRSEHTVHRPGATCNRVSLHLDLVLFFFLCVVTLVLFSGTRGRNLVALGSTTRRGGHSFPKAIPSWTTSTLSLTSTT